ncbi:hypothetical protein JCM5350_003178 [Sporobolomyces pararoseus]
MLSEAELQEQQERLTALVNVLGFTSLDHLEDFVILHGTARVVPVSSIAAAGASLPLEDTQTQGAPYSDTRHAQRNEERKRENMRLKSEVEEVRKELNWLRREHEKHVDTIEGLRNDKTRLLKLVDEADKKAEAANARAEQAEAGGGGGEGSESYQEQVAALAEETSALYQRIDNLEETIAELEEAKRTMEEQLDSAQQSHAELVSSIDQDQIEFSRLQTKLDTALDERDDALEERDGLRVEVDGNRVEIERLRTVEVAYNTMLQTIGSLASKAKASPAPVAQPSPQIVAPSSRPRRPHSTHSRLSISAPNATPTNRSRLRTSTPVSSTFSTPEPLLIPANNTTVAPAAAVPQPSAQIGIASTSNQPLPPSPATSVAAETRKPSPLASPKPSASPLADQAPPLPTSSAAAPTRPATDSKAQVSDAQAPSSTTSRLSSKQIRQLNLYPQVFATYHKSLKEFSKVRYWTDELIPKMESAILATLPPPPLPLLYPSSEFPALEELPKTEGPDGKPRSPWIDDGSLDRRYEELQNVEKRAAHRLDPWKRWMREAKEASGKAAEAKTASGEGEEIKKEQTTTPGATRSMVKKRRRISKEGATPGSNISPLTSSNVNALSKAAAPSSSTGALSRTRDEALQRPAQIHDISTSAHGETQLSASPERPSKANFVDGSHSTVKRKTWNLLSPKKKSTSSVRSKDAIPRDLPRSPSKSSPSKRRDPLTLVEDTQPAQVDPQNPHPRSSATTIELEPEPETLKSTGEGEPDTIRSSADQAPPRLPSRSTSRSPKKKSFSASSQARLSPAKQSPLRRTSAVSYDTSSLGPKPPFSPSYAAKMQKEAQAQAAADVIPSSSPPQPAPFPSGPSGSRLPFQPSPNRLSQQNRSPSSSPIKESLPMPPSAQPIRLPLNTDDTPRSTRRRGGETRETELEDGRGLLFSQERSLSPQKKRSKAKGKAKEVAVVKEEEVEEDDPFADDRQGFPKSLSPRKKQKRKSDGRDEGRTVKRSRQSKESTGFDGGEGEEEDQKPDVSQEPESEDIGEMPMGSAEEEGRKLWIRKLRNKRHEKILREKQQKQSKSSPRMQVELNPERNQGEKHAFKQTERRKAVRQSMVAEACSNCKAYYDRKKQPVPVGHCMHVEPAHASASRDKTNGNWLDMRAAEAEKRLQQDGRHRTAQRTAPEPPDYWQMGFPDTQQAEKINARAKQQKAEQEKFKIIEAEQANGLYRFRNERNDS